MSNIKISRETLTEELDLPYGAIVNEIIGTSRWSIFHWIVFEYQGKYYSTEYSEVATESQDESPWEDDDEVECTEVEEKEVMVKKWVAKE